MLIPGRIPLLFPGKRQHLKAGGIDKGYASCTIPSVKHMVDENVDLLMLISNSWHGGMTLTLSLEVRRGRAEAQPQGRFTECANRVSTDGWTRLPSFS